MVPLFLVFGDFGLLALRRAVGAILIGHGWPKIKNLRANAVGFEGMGFKPGFVWGTIVALLEFVGGIAIFAGFLVQPLAVLFAIQFVVILLTVKRGKPLIHGTDLDILILAAALALATVGGGAPSVDAFLGFVLWR